MLHKWVNLLKAPTVRCQILTQSWIQHVKGTQGDVGIDIDTVVVVVVVVLSFFHPLLLGMGHVQLDVYVNQFLR
jgi:hypothetical protein